MSFTAIRKILKCRAKVDCIGTNYVSDNKGLTEMVSAYVTLIWQGQDWTLHNEAGRRKHMNSTSKENLVVRCPENFEKFSDYVSYENWTAKWGLTISAIGHTTHGTLKIRQKYVYSHHSECYVSYGGITQRCTNVSPMETVKITVLRTPASSP